MNINPFIILNASFYTFSGGRSLERSLSPDRCLSRERLLSRRRASLDRLRSRLSFVRPLLCFRRRSRSFDLDRLRRDLDLSFDLDLDLFFRRLLRSSSSEEDDEEDDDELDLLRRRLERRWPTQYLEGMAGRWDAYVWIAIGRRPCRCAGTRRHHLIPAYSANAQRPLWSRRSQWGRSA